MRIRGKLFSWLVAPTVVVVLLALIMLARLGGADWFAVFTLIEFEQVALVAGGALLALLLLVIVVARRISARIDAVSVAAKAIGGGDFSARVNARTNVDELSVLSSAFDSMADELDSRVEELSRATVAKTAVEGELRAAQRIQTSLLPEVHPAFSAQDSFELFATNEPAAQVGGDFFDFFFRSDYELVIVMADVSGKGVPAALMMAVSRTIVHGLAAQGLGPSEILTETNRRLVADNIGSMYVTLFVGIYDVRDGIIRYGNGAHLAPLRVRTDGAVEAVAGATGTLVGILEDPGFSEADCQLEIGELLVLYTDGVTEARAPNGDFYGEAPFRRLLSAYADAPPHFLCDLINREVIAFRGGEHSDDLTLLMLRRLR